MGGMLAGKVVVVTGAGGGIGGAVVARAVAEDARTVFAADLTEEQASQACDQEGGQTRIRPCVLDVTSETSWRELVDLVRREAGSLHVLVNNAGVTDRRGIRDLDLSSWNAVIAVNQTGVFLGIKACAGLLTESAPASVVNVASIASHTGYRAIAYTASKWAVRAITQAAADELGGLGVRVTSVSPGFVNTPLTRNARRVVEAFDAATPLGRGCDPAEIAACITFLASDHASYVTGVDLSVDGGYASNTTRFVTGSWAGS